MINSDEIKHGNEDELINSSALKPKEDDPHPLFGPSILHRRKRPLTPRHSFRSKMRRCSDQPTIDGYFRANESNMASMDNILAPETAAATVTPGLAGKHRRDWDDESGAFDALSDDALPSPSALRRTTDTSSCNDTPTSVSIPTPTQELVRQLADVENRFERRPRESMVSLRLPSSLVCHQLPAIHRRRTSPN